MSWRDLWGRGGKEAATLEEPPAEKRARRRENWILPNAGPPGHTVSVTLPPEPGRQHVVTAICASYNQRLSGLLTLLENTRVAGNWFVTQERDISIPMKLAPGCGMQVTLAKPFQAPDTLVGYLTVIGYTEDAE